MTTENEIGVKITADAAGVAPATAKARGEFDSLTDAIKAMSKDMAGMASKITAALDKVDANLVQTKNKVKDVADSSETGFKRFVGGAHSGAESISSLRANVASFAQAFALAFSIDKIIQWTKAFADSKERVENLAMTFGMTTDQIAVLNAVAVTTGLQLTDLTKAMQVLDKNTVAAQAGGTAMANAFKSVGISANDGRNQMERLERIADKFQTMDDGPKKVALAMMLLGRSGASMIPILNQGSAGLRAMAEEAARFDVAGTAVSDRAQEIGNKLDAAMDTGSVAMMGLNNVIGDALGPMLVKMADSFNNTVAAMIDSYNAGGAVAHVFSVISAIIEEVGIVINSLGQIFVALWEVVAETVGAVASAIGEIFGVKVPGHMSAGRIAVNIFKDAIVIMKDVVIATIAIIGAVLETGIEMLKQFGKVAWDAFTLNWDEIDNDWNSGADRIAAAVARATAKVKAAASEAGAAGAAMLRGEDLPEAKTENIKRKSGTAGEFDPTLGKDATASTGDLRVQEWQQQLADMLLEEKNWGADSAQLSLEFWQNKLATEKLSGKTLLQAQRELARARMTVYKEEQSADVASIKLMEAARLDEAKTDIEIAKTVLQERLVLIDEQEKAGILSARRAAEERARIATEIAELERQLEARDYAAKVEAVNAEIALDHTTLAQKKSLYQQLEQLRRQHENRLRLLGQQTKLKELKDQADIRAAATKYQKASIQAFSQNLAKILTFQQGIVAGVKGLFSSLQSIVGDIFGQIIQRMVTDWLVAHGVMKAIDKLFGISGVSTSAAQAGAAAYASIAAIPVVGPGLAPAAAATASAGALSFGSLVVAERGFGEVPEDGTLAELHRKEMVLPADIASPLRNMVTGRHGANGGNPFAPANDAGPRQEPDLHVHIHAMDSADVRRFFTSHKATLAATIKSAYRDGAR